MNSKHFGNQLVFLHRDQAFSAGSNEHFRTKAEFYIFKKNTVPVSYTKFVGQLINSNH